MLAGEEQRGCHSTTADCCLRTFDVELWTVDGIGWGARRNWRDCSASTATSALRAFEPRGSLGTTTAAALSWSIQPSHPSIMASSGPLNPASSPQASEGILGQKTDLAISNILVKSGLGFGVGVVLSALLFKRRAWPVIFSTGAGLGSGYSDAERIFNPAGNIPGYRISLKDKRQQ
ncbi:uncharacterized protein L969DRAFT_44717 [Mixia osmundae IAM 14324]|uniref:MICOS complex subunit MIC10 n=1 Tax=Mixia osmundae (strain CBS 9802 / IAM 14324 / JCM 22182 / KY 12970) TaxID=764103 RepID=G7DTU7_MIXOS|nr:uncharacterized protein L969DRAFT_44717 [Mixia osmundae IAM 14324]KEI41721.1 hypothetical protein L969DRAFT_44717 [Mixia osmundae IAM 14324]GAA94007.1 hypothetical protein E5Q_00654 [Mixia osmundae IAM 14324]